MSGPPTPIEDYTIETNQSMDLVGQDNQEVQEYFSKDPFFMGEKDPIIEFIMGGSYAKAKAGSYEPVFRCINQPRIFRSSRRRPNRVEDYSGGQKIRWSDEDHGLWVGEQDIDIKANDFIRFQRSSFTEPNSCITEPE
ncbi:hypothetical protein QJS04_geneDACA004711 [Acorus gramineus]|uniref:Uncharacterized protein n=1 Tax=Acorus gramineus TaxID=55184 RepID=A0AAV9BWS6_ACOGR|nr:hypothetical protein QJS04_geneDACA004711 [Acorus gramineus]